LGVTEREPRLLAFGAVGKAPPYQIEFYVDEAGRRPVLKWIKEELTPRKRRVLGAAMNEILQHQGLGVCGTAFGRQLGDGLFEFRLREKGLLLRVFCHAYGHKVILLLGGYDKAEDPSAKRQQSEIEEARRRLRAWELVKRGPS
jgi:putative component of toxin-antitoxin plasmid stabilization module